METDRLRHFRVLVETGNMRKAAELLHISHGGLSKSVKKLEEELGVTLIRPEGRGLAITEEGRRVYAGALELLKATQDFIFGTKATTAEAKVTRIGTFEVFSTYFIGPFVAAEPTLGNLQLREYVPGKLEAAVRAKDVDLGITYLPIPHPDLSFTKVAALTMGIYTSKKAFVKTPVEQIPFVVPISPVEGSPTGVKGLDGWPDHHFPRRIGYEVDLMESGLQFVRRGLCAIFIPDFIAVLQNEVVNERYAIVRRPYPAEVKPVQRDIYVITRKDFGDETVIRKLARALRRL